MNRMGLCGARVIGAELVGYRSYAAGMPGFLVIVSGATRSRCCSDRFK